MMKVMCQIGAGFLIACSYIVFFKKYKNMQQYNVTVLEKHAAVSPVEIMFAQKTHRKHDDPRHSSQPNRGGFQRPALQSTLDKSEKNRREHFKRLVGSDPVAMAIKLDVPVQRVNDLTNGVQPINQEVAMFIEDMLSLPPSSLDTGNFSNVAQDFPIQPDVTNMDIAPLAPTSKTEKPKRKQSIIRSTVVETEKMTSKSDTTTEPTMTTENNVVSAEKDMATDLKIANIGFKSSTRKSKLEDPQIPVRMANLELLISSGRGIKAQLCRMLGRADNMYTLLRSRRIALDRKLAKQIEECIEIPEGWMEIKQVNTIDAKAIWYRQASEAKQTEPVTLATVQAVEKPCKLSPSKAPELPQDISSAADKEIDATFNHIVSLVLMRQDLQIGPIGKAAFQVFINQIVAGNFSEALALKILNNLAENQ